MSWTKKRSKELSLKFIRDISRTCSELGGVLSKELNFMLQEGRYLDVINHPIDYTMSDLTCNDAIYARQIQALLSKQDFLDLGIDKEAVAWEAFQAAERKCSETNKRLRTCASLSRDVSAVFYYAQRKIAQILGSVPSLDQLDFRFGPGANTSVKAVEANFRRKLSTALACSTNLLPIVEDLLAEVPLWTSHNATSESEDSWMVNVEVSVGKLQFVPKTCKTYRSIVIEPVLNGFFQKGIGSYLRDRLMRKANVNLKDQTHNQKLAMEGSISGHLATVDLSSASDCIANQLVWTLLPVDWALFLSYGRTGDIVYRGVEYKLEKFSSMGNAYTFELESLLFYALAYGVCVHQSLSVKEVSVYGDDVIIPVGAMTLLKEVLEAGGFSINPEKSFSEGPFRESCGADFFHGIDIRPYYLRELVSERSLFSMHNWLIRHCERELAEAVLLEVQPSYRLFGPDGYGDGHLIGSYRLRINRKVKRLGWGGGFFDTFSLKGRFNKTVLPGDWLVPSYSVYTRAGKLSPTDADVVRGSRGYAKISIYTLTSTIFSKCL